MSQPNLSCTDFNPNTFADLQKSWRDLRGKIMRIPRPRLATSVEQAEWIKTSNHPRAVEMRQLLKIMGFGV